MQKYTPASIKINVLESNFTIFKNASLTLEANKGGGVLFTLSSY